MLRSLFTGISGLKAHQQMLDVVSNNIANVNTTGYKTQNAVFEDTLSQLVRAAGASTDITGGVNPSQIGLGVMLGSVQTNFAQGSAQITNKASDLMVNGDGFFVLDNGGQTVYSRAGAFNVDTDGNLVNPDGMYVMGYGVNANGQVDSFGALKRIVLPTGLTINAEATTAVTSSGNLSPEGTSVLQASARVFDPKGTPSVLPVTFTPHTPPDGGYDINVLSPADGTTSLGTGNIAFDVNGRFDPAASSPQPMTVTVNGAPIAIDFSAMTGYSGPSSPVVTKTDGYQAGVLTQYQVGQDGVITGFFSNSQKESLGQVALATFNNPSGLYKQGNSVFTSSPDSGLAEVGAPVSGGRGSLTAGALEMSNVDLAAEFTNMIIAQRAFSANAKVITTSDEILQDLVNIKR